MKPGDTYEITIKRGEEELTFTGTLLERMDYHVFNVEEDCTDDQREFRNVWSNYLAISE